MVDIVSFYVCIGAAVCSSTKTVHIDPVNNCVNFGEKIIVCTCLLYSGGCGDSFRQHLDLVHIGTKQNTQ